MTETNSKKHSTHCVRGLTLIELLASLALLATLLVSVMSVQAQFTRQSSELRHKLAAIDAVDALLTKWWQDDGAVPISAQGRLDTPTPMAWTTRPIDRPDSQALLAQVVILEVFITEQTDPTARFDERNADDAADGPGRTDLSDPAGRGFSRNDIDRPLLQLVLLTPTPRIRQNTEGR